MTSLSPFTLSLCEWTGTGFGLVGAALLAAHIRVSRYGWLALLLANFAIIGLARASSETGCFCSKLAMR
jgi:hypothetical protein